MESVSFENSHSIYKYFTFIHTVIIIAVAEFKIQKYKSEGMLWQTSSCKFYLKYEIWNSS